MKRALVTLTPPESKRLIARAVVVMPAFTKRKLLIKHRKGNRWGFEIQPEHPYVTFLGQISPQRSTTP